MEDKLQQGDYLKLWMYFQDKAISVKGAMFNTITWILGIAAALLGFIFANMAGSEPKNAAIGLSTLMKVGSGAGIAICVYAIFAIRESAKRINNYWKNADNCLEIIDDLGKIVCRNSLQEESKKKFKKIGAIWNLLLYVVLSFLVAFVCVWVWSFCF